MKPYYETARGKLFCCDNVEYLRTLQDNTFGLTVTSPPYDSLRDYQGYSWNFEELAKELYRTTKEGGMVVWIIGDATINGSETGTSFRQALYFMECGFNLHDTMIYEKNGFSNPSDTRYHQVFEYMFVFSKGKLKTFNPIKDRKNLWESWGKNTSRQKNGELVEHRKRKSYLGEMGMRYNIWKYKVGGSGMSTKDDIAYKHPAIFPERLVYDHIVSWSNKDDLVFDPFMGSGTTAKMAEIANRRWIGCEISKEYCDITIKRVNNEIAQGKFNFSER